MSDIFRLNGVPYSWNSCIFAINGKPFTGILELSYEQKRERKVVYGAKRDGTPLGITSGKYSVASCSLKTLRLTAFEIKAMLTPLGLGSYGDASFSIALQVVEPSLTAVPITVVISGCVISGVKETQAEGVEELVTEFEITAETVVENGLVLFSRQRALP